MVVVKNGATCSCNQNYEKCRCEGCGNLFCFSCQVAYLVSPGFLGSNEKKRCCPECHDTAFAWLNETGSKELNETINDIIACRKGSTVFL